MKSPALDETERRQIIAYWREKGVSGGTEYVLANHGFHNEEAIGACGYDEIMRLDIDLQEKTHICRLMAWDVPRHSAIFEAWIKAGLSTRAANVLAHCGFIDAIGVSQIRGVKLLGKPNCGKATVDEIEKWLRQNQIGCPPELTIGQPPSALTIERPPLSQFSDEELLEELLARRRRLPNPSPNGPC